MPPGPLVEVRGLRHRYDDGTLALDGVDFLLFPGDTVALFGPNGSGKTTFAHHLNGLLTGEGYVSVCGLALEKKNLAEIRRKVGMVFQESDEQLFMSTVIEDVTFGPLNLGRTPEEALAEGTRALQQVGMEQAAGKAPYHLSAGEKKRVALAGVLAMNPEILILDEPTTSLDPPAQRSLAAMLRNLTQSKILITHDASFARALSTHAVFFEKGRVVAAGPVAEIIERFHWDMAASNAQQCVRR
jgi:cobalt/nickel transport system ATP-binding protein